MGATSTAILNAGVSGMSSLFTSLLTYALANWIPVVIAIVVVVSVIGFIMSKGTRLFGGHGGR
jgi:hypothetical protein